jgi:bifunctional non-homologous end joining protein LigD
MITHPDRVLFPDSGITKGELAAYYEMIAVHAAAYRAPAGHDGTLPSRHWPARIHSEGVSNGFPDWLQWVEVPKKDGVVHYPIVTSAESLLWLVNQNSITPHVWTSRAPDLRHPEICVFDMDPSVNDAAMLREAALAVRDVLQELGLPSWVKTSGSKGFHIAVPAQRKSGH